MLAPCPRCHTTIARLPCPWCRYGTRKSLKVSPWLLAVLLIGLVVVGAAASLIANP